MPAAAKLDLFKEHPDEYVLPREPVLVDVAPAQYLAIDGSGVPGGEPFQAMMGAIFGAAYTIKMTVKADGRDYKVCPPEGLWPNASDDVPKEQWTWTLQVRTPDFITDDDLAAAKQKLLDKGKGPEIENVELRTLHEGQCVQILHVGPYDTESETIATMHAFAAEQGLTVQGPHHEIYLSDPRRADPEKLKTLLRQPVQPS